jgi:low temperature requirement protein LtrA
MVDGGVEPTAHDEAPDRIEWLELFFDLVAVAAVAVLSEGLLEDQTWGGLGLFLVTYGAVWFAWVSVVMYTDVAGELTKVRTVVVSMFLLAVMAAASPGHAGHRANAFAVAFLLVRLFAARGALRTGRLMTAWPLLQFGSFTIPWIISLWVAVPGKYVLWGAAVLFELGLVMVRGEQVAQRALVHFHQRVERRLRADADRDGDRGTRGQREMPEFREVGVDREHLDERLGLFVIIVLGETVATLVLTAAQSPWDREFVSTVLASFALLVLLWLLTFSYGFASAPGVRLGELAPRIGLPLHLVSTTGILLIGVGISEAASTEENLHGLILWVTCGGLSVHALASLVGGIIGGTGRFWLYSCALPTVVFPMLVAAVAASLEEGLPNQWLIWLLALPVAWQFLYAQRHSELLRLGKLQRSAS